MLRLAKVTMLCLVSDQGEGPEAVSGYVEDLLSCSELACCCGEYDQALIEEIKEITTEWVKEDK